jgi:acetyltransferase-like isoleucine patch superfamily enzyme
MSKASLKTFCHELDPFRLVSEAILVRLKKIEVKDSALGKNVRMGTLTHIIKTNVLNNVTIYKNCWLVDSFVGNNVLIGDGSKLDKSHLGNFVRIGKNNHLYHADFQKHSYTGQNTVIMYSNIGKFCSISWNVTIGGAQHDYKRITTHAFLYNDFNQLNEGKVFYNRFDSVCNLGNDVWVGANSVILRGANIADGVVVGAGSVVTKSVPPYAIVVGNPAKIIKFRFSEHIIERLLELKWWEQDDDFIRKHCNLFAKEPTDEIIDELEAAIKTKE